MNSRRIFFSVILAASLAIAFTACGQSESEPVAVANAGPALDPPGPIDAQVGETVERDGVTIKLHETGATTSFGGNVQADDGFFFISAKMSITNTGSGELAQGAEALVLELPGGEEGRFQHMGPSTLVPLVGPAPGLSHDYGWRSWQVPTGTRSATLSYRPTADLEIRFAVFTPTEIRDRWLEGGQFKLNAGAICGSCTQGRRPD